MTLIRAHITVQGVVQGVGFRPFIHRLAHQADLGGWVTNTAQGVVIEIEGDETLIHHFLGRIKTELPPHAHITDMQVLFIPPIGDTTFTIQQSQHTGSKTAHISPDLAVCPDCLHEMNDPNNRRYRYPFINCTHCGTRYSIMTDLPYDRPNTTMHTFVMCDACQKEYDDPSDRRFHAQPIACPVCGPHIELWDADGRVVATHEDALRLCADALRTGEIIAMKGLGGFHLLVDATNPEAIRALRERKHRPHKPFAVMFPNMAMIEAWCVVDDVERDLLLSAQAPIVLLEKNYPHPLTPSPQGGEGEHSQNPIDGFSPPFSMQWGKGAGGIGDDLLAPDNPTLGAMLPYTPLHHLLLAECGFPLVATSGNRHDEPICTDEHDALTRLAGIADLFLVHNRPITRPVDDSVVRVMAGRMMMVRRARGYAPLPININPHPLTPSPLCGEGEHFQYPINGFSPPFSMQWGKGAGGIGDNILAVGAHLKNAIALQRGQEVFISQHIGDLSTSQAQDHFERTITDLSAMLDISPQRIACDAHPDYASTAYAHHSGLPITKVQHHYAHALACMAENEVQLPALAVVWDGTGYGDDGTIWGGEFLRISADGYQRVGYLRPFPLLGGESAVIEPRKTALGWLYSLFGEAIFDDDQFAPVRQFTLSQRNIFRQMVLKGVNCPMTSSMGRLFDAVASVMDMCHVMSHEAQGAVMLENLAQYPHPLTPSPQGGEGELWQNSINGFAPPFSMQWGKGVGGIGDKSYPFDLIHENNTHIIHPHAMLKGIMADISAHIPKTIISQKFHATLIEMIVQMAHRIGENRVMLTGGCFMNKPLLEGAIYRLREAGFIPYWHSQVPTGDGGVCLGQLLAL
ncbi:MAG: carbamoyltransferase HypF [bacterium]|nr:carbamoyltransferase HypF [bacterium]